MKRSQSGQEESLWTWPRVIALAGAFIGAAFWFVAASGCKPVSATYRGRKVLRVMVRSDIGGLDPIFSDSMYDSKTSALVTEPLLQYHYLKRPLTVKPLLVAKMPDVSKDGLTYTFTLKKGIMFHDDPSFPKGKGRELVSKDVIYSIKRMAERAANTRGWWVYSGRIVGFDQFRAQQYKLWGKNRTPFNVDAPVEGLKILGRYRFQIKLTKPFPQFLYLLAFQKTAIVPREAVEYYAKKGRGGFRRHPVGTGPFMLKQWQAGIRLVFRKNPHYQHSRFPVDGFNKKQLAAGFAKRKGAQLPFVDFLEVGIYKKDQPAWLKFMAGDLDYVQIAAEYWPGVFHSKGPKAGVIRKQWASRGFGHQPVALMDFIYVGFNFKDKLVGCQQQKVSNNAKDAGVGQNQPTTNPATSQPTMPRLPQSKDCIRSRYLRQALLYAFDQQELNKRFYNNMNKVYAGAVPVMLSGAYPDPLKRDLKKAKALLAKAGYPGGKLPNGKPLVITISTSQNSSSSERSEVIQRQFAQIGVKVKYDFGTFPQLSKKLRSSQTQMFSLAWGSDYPDAENNLALFWGPNRAPGSNSWNYDNPAYNRLYEKARVMFPSPERARLYKRMNKILIDDAVFLGSMARIRYYLWSKRLGYMVPNETMASYWKYLDVPAFK